MAASNFKRSTSSVSISPNNKIRRIRRRKGLFALSAAASAVALVGLGRFARADTKSFEYNYNAQFGANVPNTNQAGQWSGDLTNTFWFDLTNSNATASAPTASDIAQFDVNFANMNPSGAGGPPLGANVGLTLGVGQTNYGGLNIIAPANAATWVNGSGVTAPFIMSFNGKDTTSFLQIGAGGISVGNSGTFEATDTQINVPIVLGAAQAWNVTNIPVTLTNTTVVSAGNTLTVGVVTNSTGLLVNGTVSLGGKGANALSINGNNTTSGSIVTLSGAISDGGTASGISASNVTLNLSVSNSFTGGLTVGAGSLVTTGIGNGFGGVGNNITMAGGTIEVTGSGGGVRNFNTYSVDGSGISADGLGDDVTWTGVPLNININSTANTFTINQHLAGSLTLNQSGGGAIVLGQATNTYTGGTTIGAGGSLTAPDFASLGTGPFTNAGTFNVLTSVNVSGGAGGNGGALQIGGGFGSTMTVTNVNGPLNNTTVGDFNNATLVLDFSQGNVAQPLVTGGTAGAVLNMGGGNLLIIPNATAAAIQVFTTTNFTGASAAAPGQIHNITATGAAGQATVFFGSYDFDQLTGGFSTIEKSNTQYGNEVIFNGPLANVGTATPVSDFAVAGNTETFASVLVSSESSGSGTPTTSLGGNYYSGFALYGNSDFAFVTAAVNGTSYIVPGSAISGGYLEVSVSAPNNTTSALFTSDGIAVHTLNRPALADVQPQVWDVDAPGPFYISAGNEAYQAIRFNSPTGGFSTAGGNSMIQLLTLSLVESGDILVTPNVGANDILIADLAKVAAGASSNGTQDQNLGRNAGGDFTFWNEDYQGNTSGILINAEGESDAKSAGSGVSLLGPGMFANIATNGYTGPTTIQGGVDEINTNLGLGGSGTAQNAIEFNAGTLVAMNSIALDNSLFNTGTLLTRSIFVGPLGAVIAASNGTTMKVDGTMTGTGNLVIGMGTFIAVTQGVSSTLGLTLSTGGGTIILSGNHTGFTGNISIDNTNLGGQFNAALQLDGSYSSTTTVTVPDNNNLSLLTGAPTTTIASVYVGQGQIFYPGDVGNGSFSVANITFGNTSALQFAMNPATTSTTDVLTVTQKTGFNTAGTVNLSFFQAGTAQNFNTTGVYDLLNVFGSTNAFSVNGTLAANSVSTQINEFSLSGNSVTPLTTYALATVPVGANETELELLISSQVIAATWINPGSGFYDVPGNWLTNNGLNIVPNGLVDTAIFSSNGLSNPTVVTLGNGSSTTNDTAGNLVFNATNSYTITGGTFYLNNGTNTSPVSAVVLDQLGSHSIGSVINMPAGVSVVVTNATDSYTMSGLIQNGTVGASTINSAGLQINGVNLQGSPIQQGSGTVILATSANGGTETYSGGTSIFGGTLQVGNGTVSTYLPVQGAASPMLFDGTLAFDEASGNTYTFTNTVNVAANTGTFAELAPNTLVVLTPGAAYQPTSNPVNLTIAAGDIKQGNATAEVWGIVNMTAGSIFDLNSLASTVGSLSGAGTVQTEGGNTSFGIGGNSATTTWAGTIKNTAGTLALNKTGNGGFIFAANSTNTFNGGLTENGGFIRFSSTTNIPTGPLNGITIGTAVSATNGPLILSNGVTLANPILDQQGTGDLVELPDVNETAYLSGAITFAGSNQMRLGYTTAFNKLYVSGTEVNSGSNLGFFIGGDIDLFNGYSLTTGATGFGRDGTNTLDLRLFGNAAITLTAATGGVMGFNGNGGNMPEVTIETNGTSSINLLSGTLEMDNSGASSVLNTIVLNGGSITTGQVTFTPPSASAAAQATAVIDFNGGILIADASHTDFLPFGTLGHFYMNVGSLGVKLSTNGFNEIINSAIGFNSGSTFTGPGNSDPNFNGQDGGIKKLGAGNLSFTSSFGEDNLGSEVNGRIEVAGGSMDYAGANAASDMLVNAAYAQVDPGGAIGADDGSLSDSTLISKLTAAGAPASQSGGLLLSTNDLSTNIDYTGLQLNAFNMANPGGSGNTISFANMSIGAVADPGANGTTGVALVYTGTITPANAGALRNTYLLGGGGTLALANLDAITGANKLLVENGGVVWLQEQNTYSGGTTITGNQVLTNDLTGASQLETTTLLVNFLGDADANGSSLGTSNPNNPANLIINGGTLEYIGNGDTSNLLFTLGSLGGHIDSSGSGALILQNTGSEAFGAGVAGTFAFILSGSEGTIGTIQSIAAGTASTVNKLYASVSGPAGATISFVKQGAGAWELKGSNSFAGGMSILGGQVQLGSPNAMWLNTGGSFAQVTINSLLDLNGNNLTVGLVTGSTGGIIDNVLNALDPVLTINTGNFGPSFTITTTGTVTTTNTFLAPSATYSGSILNSNGTALTAVSITGNGNQIFSGNSNFYGGGTTIGNLGNGTLTTLTLAGSNGTLGATPVGTGNVTDNGLFQLSRSDALVTLSNNIIGTGIVNVTNGTYLFAMSTASWTGGTTIGNTATGAMVRLNSANLLPTTGGITINQALDLNGFNGQFNIPVLSSTAKGEITNTNGSVTVTITNTNATGTVGLSFQNGINNVAGNNNTGALAVIFTGGGNIALTSTASSNIGGTLIDTGTTLSLVGANGTPLGAAANTVYDNGTLVILPAETALTLANNITGPGAIIQSGGTTGVTYNGTNSYTGGTIINTGGTATIGSFTTPLGTGGVVDNGIINLNSVGLTVTGSGLSGTAAAAQVLQNQVLNTATFVNSSASTSTFAGQFINTGKLVFGVGATATTVMSGALALTQNGPGTLVLTGANTYVGPTAITGGTLEIGNGGSTGSIGTGVVAGVSLVNPGAVSISSGAALVYNLSSSPTVANSISGGGSFSQIGSGTVSLTGNNIYLGGTSIGVGSSLNIASATGLPAASPVSNSGNFIVSAGTKSNAVTSGHITGNGTVTITNNGYLTLASGSHTATASSVVVNAGSTLNISNNTVQINYGSPANDPITAITADLAAGYQGGAWTGTSATTGVITSTTAAAGSPGETLSVGVNDSDVDGGNSNQVVVKYTLAGDTNLDGLVNFGDLVAVLQNFNKGGTDWAHGNFSYGVSTNFGDLVTVLQNFNKTLSPGVSTGSTLGGGGTIGLSSSVEVSTVQVQNTDVQLPEPASFTLLGAGAAGLLARRRRKTAK